MDDQFGYDNSKWSQSEYSYEDLSKNIEQKSEHTVTDLNGVNSNYYSENNSNNTDLTAEFKKKYKKLAIKVGLILSLIVVVIISASVALVLYLKNNSSSSSDSSSDQWDFDWDEGADGSDSDADSDWDEGTDGFDYDFDWDEGTSDSDSSDSTYNPNNKDWFGDKIDWDDKAWKKEPVNYSADEVWDSNHRYYLDLKNCIDEDLDYKVVYYTEENTDKSKNVCMRATYYQIEGDIPNLDIVNKALKENALYYVDKYYTEADAFDDWFKLHGNGYIVDSKSYVTYNDDKMFSMVTQSSCESIDDAEVDLRGITVDLITGMVKTNVDMLDVTDEFAAEVVSHSDKQNGSITYVDSISMSELKYRLADDKSIILFFTPCGMEVGLNYKESFAQGWFTTTFTDYEKYLKTY